MLLQLIWASRSIFKSSHQFSLQWVIRRTWKSLGMGWYYELGIITFLFVLHARLMWTPTWTEKWACIIMMALAIIRFWIRKTWRWGSYNMFSRLFYHLLKQLKYMSARCGVNTRSNSAGACSAAAHHFQPRIVLRCSDPAWNHVFPKHHPNDWKLSQISSIYCLAFFFEGGSTGSAAFPRFLEAEPRGSSESSVLGWLFTFALAFGSALALAFPAGLMFLSCNRLVTGGNFGSKLKSN